MADSMRVSGPVEVMSDSAERVAFDLALKIDYFAKDQEKDAKYWLSLYRQCYKATNGFTLKGILEVD